jgi:3-oxoacyl-[acyl-carrier protein] reductase
VLAANLDGAFYLAREVVPEMKRAALGKDHQHLLARRQDGRPHGRHRVLDFQGGAHHADLLARARARAAWHHRERHLAGLREDANGHRAAERGPAPALLAQIPVGRFCEPEEFAHVVRFLAHPLAGFITGEIVDLNGGLHMD